MSPSTISVGQVIPGRLSRLVGKRDRHQSLFPLQLTVITILNYLENVGGLDGKLRFFHFNFIAASGDTFPVSLVVDVPEKLLNRSANCIYPGAEAP